MRSTIIPFGPIIPLDEAPGAITRAYGRLRARPMGRAKAAWSATIAVLTFTRLRHVAWFLNIPAMIASWGRRLRSRRA